MGQLNQKKVGGLILAGGRASRMNYINKALVKLNGKPLISYPINTLKNQTNYLALSVNRDLEIFKNFNLPLFTDKEELKNLGPFSGILSSIKYFPEYIELILVTPCDVPFIPNNLVEKLKKKLLSNEKYQACYASTKKNSHHCTILFYKKLYPLMLNYIKSVDNYSLKSWLTTINSTFTIFEDEKNFDNINYQEQLLQYKLGKE